MSERSGAPAGLSAPDPGLFGPDSVSWRIHGDPSIALGGLRALMLQAVHPLVMAGVAQHSQYRSDPWGRLERTGEYVAAVTYGTIEQARRAIDGVRTVHEHVVGVEPESGMAYSASDPGLLLWVHCAAVDSFLEVYLRCGGPLKAGDADRYVAEQARVAALVGIDPGDCPVDRGELTEYFRCVRSDLRVTAAAREGLRFLFSPPMPLPARPVWVGFASIAFAMLPRWTRLAYGLPGVLYAHPGVDLAALAAGRGLRTIASFLPRGMAESPARREALQRLGA